MNWSGEPKLAEALCDPVVQAVMEADGVDARELGATLSRVARTVRLGRPVPAGRDRGRARRQAQDD
ncbi:MAG TPA: hypothetical protein VJ487_16860 [Alphaproteobacteria bacterium]|nr:hypothetical protein [Alphaproteobacteria bacterium]